MHLMTYSTLLYIKLPQSHLKHIKCSVNQKIWWEFQ